MRVPLSWLREFVDVQLTPEQLADALTMRGIEVRSVERWGSSWGKFVVGELLEVSPHPRADRLQLTKVRVGNGEVLNVVCGARNIATGQRVPVALIGAHMPDGRTIERAEKLGVASEGMLCSGKELDATDDGEGILILDGAAPIGSKLVDYLGEDVIDVDVKPNRGDLLSVLGLAREVAAIVGAPVRYAPRTVQESQLSVADGLALHIAPESEASRVVLRVVDDVKVAPAPDAVQMRLKAAGLRSVSNVVDATNYIMLELGKPTHAFDRAAVGARVEIRRATRGESLETLDHTVRTLDIDDVVVADERGVLALAGVMGGASSEVGAATTSVVIESALFAPGRVRRTAQRHSLRSEASHRFERGQEWDLAASGADQVAALLTTWAGGAPRMGRLDSALDAAPMAATLYFRPARARQLLGADLDDATQAALLKAIGIETKPGSGNASVSITPGRAIEVVGKSVLGASVPAWRRDLAIEADLIEEVARLYGYDQLPATLPSAGLPSYRPQPTALRDTIRQLLAAVGLQEVVTHALVAPALLARHTEPAGIITGALSESEGVAEERPLALSNPLSADHDHLRLSLLPSLLDRVDANLRYGAHAGAIFEVGRGYGRGAKAPREWTRLAVALWGAVEGAAPGNAPKHWDLDEAKRLLAAIASTVGGRVAYGAAPESHMFHPGRSATVLGDVVAGVIGEIHPAAPEWHDTPRIIVAEIAVAGLASGAIRVPQVQLSPSVPPLTRDIALVLPSKAMIGTLMELAHTTVPEATQIELFDLFSGGTLASGERSVGLRFTFQPSEPGGDGGAASALERFGGAATRTLGARVRGEEGA